MCPPPSFFAPGQKVVLLTCGGLSVNQLWLDKPAFVRCRALHLTRRNRCAAYADLSSDKERLRKISALFCVIPREAEGPRIFYGDRHSTPIQSSF